MIPVLEPSSLEQRKTELQTNLRFIARALRRIEIGEDLEPELRNLRTFILDCLEGAEPTACACYGNQPLPRPRSPAPGCGTGPLHSAGQA
jgi:hypothetical protein